MVAEGIAAHDRGPGTSVLLSAFDIDVSIESDDPAFVRLFRSRYSRFPVPSGARHPHLRYRYLRGETGAPRLFGPYGRASGGQDSSEALEWIDADIVVALQQLRPDLLFLHAAALERDGMVCLLAANAGVGKSTTAWALLHHGFSYASDELGAVDAQNLVHPFPRALCLKRASPAPYAPPASAARVGTSLHLSPEALPGRTVDLATRLGAVFVLERAQQAPAAGLRSLTAAEAAARLYPNVLNALAHPDRGLAPVLRLVGDVPCYRLSLGALDHNCALIREAFDSLRAATPR